MHRLILGKRPDKIFNSVEAWRKFANSLDHRIKVLGNDGQSHPAYEWVNGKEIQIHRMPDVPEDAVEYIVEGIDGLIRQIGLDVNINYSNSHSSVEEVRKATECSDTLYDGTLDRDKLVRLLVVESWRNPIYGGRPHADVIITSQYINWFTSNRGSAGFLHGYMVISLPKDRQIPPEEIVRISRHEAGHLLGLYEHHYPSITVKGYDPTSCNMEDGAPVLNTCNMHLDSLRFFWLGLQKRTGVTFFK